MRSIKVYNKAILFSIIIAIGIYIVSRAILVPITHDEAFTILKHVPNSYSVILGLRIAPVEEFANNHSLNTASIKFLISYFPMSELVVRFPNILAGFVFIIIFLTILIRLEIKDWTLSVLFLYGISSPLLLEFFALARGYGLSISLFFAGYFFWLTIDRDQSSRFFLRLSVAGIFFSLALIANLSIAFAILGVALTEIVQFIVELNKNKNGTEGFNRIRIVKLLTRYAISIFPALFLLNKVYGKTLPIAKQQNLFYVQNREGYLTGTLPSIARDWTPILTKENQILYSKICLFIFLPAVLFFIYRLLIRKDLQQYKYQKDLLVAGTFFFVSVSPSVMDIFFHTGFPYERTALYILPIYALFLSVLIRSLGESENLLIRFYRYLLIFLMTLTIALSLFTFNVRKTNYWSYDSTSRVQYLALKKDVNHLPQIKEKRISVGVDWLLEPSLNYYFIQEKDNKFLSVNRESPLNPKFDYVFLIDGFEGRVQDKETFYLQSWRELEYWPESGVRLIRNERAQNSKN
ncbi:hypothetical protein [Leptospira sanjuanensis]|uniref:hypothetical protein n=1 Tax=Leptospira sanjuanensis TaxID=2879643 RepID=UPI001EE97CB5|nr:hypothetical protein [Leptospira sanjuanensis]MCG6167485.1 hypothetical protein [Leptospira sanjuanensis]